MLSEGGGWNMELKIMNVCKTMDKKKILNNISLHIGSGKCLGLVGPNGAGKTSLIRSILGLYNYEGEVLYGDLKQTEVDMSKNKIMFILDTSGLLRNLNVRENVEFFSRVYCESASSAERNEKVDSILKKINLYEYSHKKIKTLSRGMKQRLAIGRTMVITPELFILDEPYVGLDVEAQIFLTNYLQALKKKGCTILISSHDLGHLEKVCDEIAFISNGTIIKCVDVDRDMVLEDIYKEIYIKDQNYGIV